MMLLRHPTVTVVCRHPCHRSSFKCSLLTAVQLRSACTAHRLATFHNRHAKLAVQNAATPQIHARYAGAGTRGDGVTQWHNVPL